MYIITHLRNVGCHQTVLTAFMWRFYVALLCGAFMWRFYVALLCGAFMWRFYVALLCGAFMWIKQIRL
jgi:hypothetical protein